MLRTILVPLDGSELAERALPTAFDLARRTGGEIHLVRVHAPLAIIGATADGMITQDLLATDEAVRERSRAYLADVAARSSAEWGVRAVPHLSDGSASANITDVAERVKADLIVMTTHGHGGFAPDWMGSVTDAVIRHSHRPVLALPIDGREAAAPFTPRSILVTLDGSDHARTILPAAQGFALAFGARVALVRVVAPFVPNDALSTLTQSSPDAFGVDTDAAVAKAELDREVASLESAGVRATATVLEERAIVRSLLDHVKASDADCLAIATQGRGLSRIFVGSVADKLIRSARRPVLVLRPAK